MIIFIEFLLPAWPPAVMPMHFQLASCIYSHHICLFQGLVFISVKKKKSLASAVFSVKKNTRTETFHSRFILFIFHRLKTDCFSILKLTAF